MSAPTGEAVNYATTINELEAIRAAQREWLDAATATLRDVESAKAHIADMQDSYNTAAAAATNIGDSLAALNLDSDTLGHVGAMGDAMPAGRVNSFYDGLEAVEVEAAQQRDNAETALGATEAAIATVQDKYSAATETVSSELDGDPAFVGGGM